MIIPHPPKKNKSEKLVEYNGINDSLCIFQTGSGSYSGSFLEAFQIRIGIPTYRLHGYGSDTHYEYEVKVIPFQTFVHF